MSRFRFWRWKIKLKRKENFSSQELGQSLTELALMMVFLLILVAGIVDIGRAFFTYIALRDAAQEGAIYASYEPSKCSISCIGSDCAVYRAQTTSNLPVDLLNDPNVDITCTIFGDQCAGTDPGPYPNSVVIEATYGQFPLTMPFMGTLIGSQSITISASIEDQIITPLCP